MRRENENSRKFPVNCGSTGAVGMVDLFHVAPQLIFRRMSCSTAGFSPSWAALECNLPHVFSRMNVHSTAQAVNVFGKIKPWTFS
jgi:hypothetical protein